MDWKQNGSTLVVIGTIILLIVCVVLVIFVINHKRKLHGKQMLIDLYENKLEKRVKVIEEELGIEPEEDAGDRDGENS